jgi:hypothetical protein
MAQTLLIQTAPDNGPADATASGAPTAGICIFRLDRSRCQSPRRRAAISARRGSSRRRGGVSHSGIAWKSRPFRASRAQNRALAGLLWPPAHIAAAWRGRNFIAAGRADRAAIAAKSGRSARVDLRNRAD